MPEPCQRKLEEKIQVKIPKEKFSNSSINKNFTHKVFEENILIVPSSFCQVPYHSEAQLVCTSM